MTGSPPESGAGRAVGALRTALLVTAGTCVGFGVLGAALVLLRGDADAWPGLSMLLAAQAVALAAAVVTGLGLHRVLRGAEPRPVTRRVRAAYARLESVLGALLVAGVTAWMLARPDAWLAVCACALVAAQFVLVLRLIRR